MRRLFIRVQRHPVRIPFDLSHSQQDVFRRARKVNLMMAEYSFDEADRCFNAHLYHGEKEIVLDLRINPDSGRIEKISFNGPE